MCIALQLSVKFLRIKTTAISLFFSTLLSQYGREMFPSGISWRSVRRAEKYCFIWHTKIGKAEFFGRMGRTYYLLVLLAKGLFFDHIHTPVT